MSPGRLHGGFRKQVPGTRRRDIPGPFESKKCPRGRSRWVWRKGGYLVWGKAVTRYGGFLVGGAQHSIPGAVYS